MTSSAESEVLSVCWVLAFDLRRPPLAWAACGICTTGAGLRLEQICSGFRSFMFSSVVRANKCNQSPMWMRVPECPWYSRSSPIKKARPQFQSVTYSDWSERNGEILRKLSCCAGIFWSFSVLEMLLDRSMEHLGTMVKLSKAKQLSLRLRGHGACSLHVLPKLVRPCCSCR